MTDKETDALYEPAGETADKITSFHPAAESAVERIQEYWSPARWEEMQALLVAAYAFPPGLTRTALANCVLRAPQAIKTLAVLKLLDLGILVPLPGKSSKVVLNLNWEPDLSIRADGPCIEKE